MRLLHLYRSLRITLLERFMAKPCTYEGCPLPQFGGGYCKIHQHLRQDGKAPKSLKKNSKPLNRSKIREVSEKRVNQLKQYAEERKKYLRKNPYCYAYLIGRPASGCTKMATDFNHGRGRENARLLDFKDGNALCRTCHIYYTEHSKEAYEYGILKHKHRKDVA